MRRWMRSLIVALLCLTLSVDTAKACWWRRHRTTTRGTHPVVRYQPIDIPVCCAPVEDTAEVLSEEVVIDYGVSTMPVTDWRETEMETPGTVDFLSIDEQVEVSAEPTLIADDTSTVQALELSGIEQTATPADTVVVHGPTLVIDTPTAAAPTPASIVTAPAGSPPLPTATPAVLPNPTSAQEPLPDLQPATTPPAVEPNLFDRYGDNATATGDDALLTTGDPLDQPSDDAAVEGTPAADEAPPEQPAEETSPEAAFLVPDEPMRRWANAAGTHQTQGWLVALRADRVRILKVNGRHTTVSRASLSAEDRAYVSAVSDRLAADRRSTADPIATAGL